MREKLPRSGIENYSHKNGILGTGIPVLKNHDCANLHAVKGSKGRLPKGQVSDIKIN